jgi:hypothetical protein
MEFSSSSMVKKRSLESPRFTSSGILVLINDQRCSKKYKFYILFKKSEVEF